MNHYDKEDATEIALQAAGRVAAAIDRLWFLAVFLFCWSRCGS